MLCAVSRPRSTEAPLGKALVDCHTLWVSFDKGFCSVQVFLCTDLWKDAAILHAAYCDSKGITEAFIKNGMLHALHALGVGAQAKPECWEYDVVINPVDRRVSHQQAPSIRFTPAALTSELSSRHIQ